MPYPFFHCWSFNHIYPPAVPKHVIIKMLIKKQKTHTHEKTSSKTATTTEIKKSNK